MRALRRGIVGERQAVPICRHRAQAGSAIHGDGVNENAVQIIARLFSGNGEAGLVDQPRQFRGFDFKTRLKSVRRHRRKIASGKHWQMQARLARGNKKPRIIARHIELNRRSVRQFAYEVVEIVRWRRGLSRAFDLGRGRFRNLDIQIGCRQAQAVALGGHQHVGENGNCISPFDHALNVIECLQERRALDRQPHFFFLGFSGFPNGTQTNTPART